MRHLLCLAGLAACVPAMPAPLPAAFISAGATRVGEATLLDAVTRADLICVGEQHDDPVHHRYQHALLSALTVSSKDRPLALGLEMFQRRFQPALDDLSRGLIGLEQLAVATEWADNWGFDYGMYRPLLHTATESHVQLVALNAPRALTRAVARDGLLALPPDVSRSLPELDLGDVEHKRYFFAAMGFDDTTAGEGSHGHHGDGERFYAAQVLWDETMAESAAAWLTHPARRIMVIAGNGHCHETAIPKRVRRRVVDLETVSVLLRSGDDELPPHAESDFVVTFARPPALSLASSPDGSSGILGSSPDGSSGIVGSSPDGSSLSARLAADPTRTVTRRVQ